MSLGPSSTRRRAADPDGRVIVVEGEAGIGKTRLAEVAADEVRARGGVVLAAAAIRARPRSPTDPIADLLRHGLASADGADRLTALDPTALGEISRLVDMPVALRGSARLAPEWSGDQPGCGCSKRSPTP